jgi:hypothetical protein
MRKHLIRQATAGIIVAAGLAGSLTACAGVNHDAPNPSQDIQYRWVRIETPPSFTTLMFGCFGTTGIYMDQNDGNANENPNDPLCPIANVFSPAIQRKYGFRLVTRTSHQGAGTS